MGARAGLCIFTFTLCACTSSPRISLPQGSGTPFHAYQKVFGAALEPCQRVRTIEFMLAISGQTGDTKLRGRVRGAFAKPALLRLEGLSPFGPPGFVLVTSADAAVLLLPRERRVITDATGRDLLDVLAGLALDPADFLAVLTGCFVPQPHPMGARTFGNGWVSVDLEGGATLFLHEVDGIPVVVAGRRDGLVVEYRDHTRGLPRRIRIQTTDSSRVVTDLIATLSQMSINVDIDNRAFVADIPDQFKPMTVDALWDTAGPLEDAPDP